MRHKGWWLVSIACLGLAGCATVMNGTTQDIGITSQPPGAAVTVDTELKGLCTKSDSLSGVCVQEGILHKKSSRDP